MQEDAGPSHQGGLRAVTHRRDLLGNRFYGKNMLRGYAALSFVASDANRTLHW